MLNVYSERKRTTLLKKLLRKNIPTIHSSIWNMPRPGHSPRFDPKKLRESKKLNLSTEVTFTLTSSLKIKLNINPLHLVVVPFSTVATVLKQGSRQSETITPENKSPEYDKLFNLYLWSSCHSLTHNHIQSALGWALSSHIV